MELTGVTPGTEYLLKVNNREVKEGVADSDKVSRKFRMPNLGDKRREARPWSWCSRTTPARTARGS